jgi:preprotein translocase subunit SecE
MHYLIKFLPVKSTLDFLSSVKLELSKVIWPKRHDVIKLTIVILLISGVVAIYLGSLDFALTKLFEAIIIN